MDMFSEITDLPSAIAEARALAALGRTQEGYEVLDIAIAWAEAADPPVDEPYDRDQQLEPFRQALQQYADAHGIAGGDSPHCP